MLSEICILGITKALDFFKHLTAPQNNRALKDKYKFIGMWAKISLKKVLYWTQTGANKRENKLSENKKVHNWTS